MLTCSALVQSRPTCNHSDHTSSAARQASVLLPRDLQQSLQPKHSNVFKRKVEQKELSGGGVSPQVSVLPQSSLSNRGEAGWALKPTKPHTRGSSAAPKGAGVPVSPGARGQAELHSAGWHRKGGGTSRRVLSGARPVRGPRHPFLFLRTEAPGEDRDDL